MRAAQGSNKFACVSTNHLTDEPDLPMWRQAGYVIKVELRSFIKTNSWLNMNSFWLLTLATH